MLRPPTQPLWVEVAPGAWLSSPQLLLLLTPTLWTRHAAAWLLLWQLQPSSGEPSREALAPCAPPTPRVPWRDEYLAEVAPIRGAIANPERDVRHGNATAQASMADVTRLRTEIAALGGKLATQVDAFGASMKNLEVNASVYENRGGAPNQRMSPDPPDAVMMEHAKRAADMPQSRRLCAPWRSCNACSR
jgi:hypothetical protein